MTCHNGKMEGVSDRRAFGGRHDSFGTLHVPSIDEKNFVRHAWQGFNRRKMARRRSASPLGGRDVPYAA